MRFFDQSSLLLWEPSRFFATCRPTDPNWRAGAIAPFTCAAIYLGFELVMAKHLEPVVLAAVRDSGVPPFLLTSTLYSTAVASALAFPLLWLASTAFLVSLDVLFVDRGDARKQLELAGRAFVSQIPALVLLFIAASAFDGRTLHGLDLSRAENLGQLRARFASSPMFATATAVSQLSQVWLCALLALSYRSLSGLRAATTALVAALLYGIFFLGGMLIPLLLD
ncbi:MAG: hypothetical protein GEV06_08870 [Luteitalea sp.]|nr:hypothetical protein [Luteitalea sp.]